MIGGLIAFGLGWLLATQGYGKRKPETQPEPGVKRKAAPISPAEVPWPVQVTPDVAPPGGTPQQKRDWAAVQTAQYEERKAREMMLEDMQRAEQAKAK